jgi:TonB family protein
MVRLVIRIMSLVLLCPLVSFGDDTQSRAEAMLGRARAASDLRSEHGVPFRLRFEFSFVSEELETVHGTYTEWWISDHQWRRETISSESHRIEISGPGKKWLLETEKSLPQQVRAIPALVAMFPPNDKKFEFHSVLDSLASDSNAQCTITAPGPGGQKSAYCFHKPSGVLIQKIEPFAVGNRMAAYRCDYAAFQMFGTRTFPREMACFLEGHKKIEGKVTELTADFVQDPALFRAPPEAVELDACSGKLKLPSPISDPFPPVPIGVENAAAVIELVVDSKGLPKNVRVARSGGKTFDELAVRAVCNWRFAPATCDGRPIGMLNTVQITHR